jgi:hypothetical protein
MQKIRFYASSTERIIPNGMIFKELNSFYKLRITLLQRYNNGIKQGLTDLSGQHHSMFRPGIDLREMLLTLQFEKV